ncbi:DNA replication protein DnaD [Enterococcus gallinarum]|uniref:DNA replication protein DnaD n=1 Tax=Enterococcus gallinarum TaxID=1353 RepID=UPI00255A9BEB|nr:DNA replication protein DnaD [Enterococcus gallinarum]MDL4908628.1 DNA replication protein DnaD [Enterococcus gallinarum]
MAEKRMLSKAFISSASFMKMSDSAKLLYVYLNVNADDDGIVEVFPYSQMLSTPEDDVKVLLAKGFIFFLNDDWLAFLPHWLQNQYIRNDRYKPSIYHNQLLNMNPEFFNKIPEAPLKQILDKKQTEVLRKDLLDKWYPTGIPLDYQNDTQLRLSQSSLIKSNLDKVSVDKISQIETDNQNCKNVINDEGIQIINKLGDRFSEVQRKKFISVILSMKDSVEREYKIEINSAFFHDKTNKMLKKLFSSMNDKLNLGVLLDEIAYVNTTSRNFWKEIAEVEKKSFNNVMNIKC